MKKFGFITTTFWAILAISSCEKATEIIEDTKTGNVVTIRAGFSDDTKTSYENEITFSWNEGDKIGVWTTDGNGSYEKVIFEAKSSGPSVEFQGTVSEGYTLVPDGKAFYPDGDDNEKNNFQSTFNGTSYTVTLGDTINEDLDNPMSVIPLVGNNDGSGKYTFKTATGILKVTYDCLQGETKYIIVYYSSGGATTALRGQFNLEDDEVKLANAITYSLYKELSIGSIQDGSSGVFYFPLPTGVLPSGLVFASENSGLKNLSSCQTTKEIPITRNKITNISVALDGGSSWKSLGIGKFLDNYLFNLAGHGGKAVNVEIQQNVSNPTKFRLMDPYGAAQDAFDNTLFNNSNRSSTLVFWSLNEGDLFPNGEKTASKDGLVYFEPCETGYEYSSNADNYVRISHTNFHSSTYLEYSCIRSSQTSGLPKVVQLAPKYVYGSSRTNLVERFNINNQIVILFPGCNDSEILVGTYQINKNTAFGITIDNLSAASQNIQITNYKNTNSSINWEGSFKGVYDASSGSIVFNDDGYFFYSDNNNWAYFKGYTSSAVDLSLAFQSDGTLKCVDNYLWIPAKIDGISNYQEFSGYPYLNLVL